MENIQQHLDKLNKEQKQAATHIDGALLILAGAGTGKTRTITTRLAYLMSMGIDPSCTLTLTFTNKAATEMRDRAFGLLSNIAYPPLLCTFHRFGILFLKMYISKLNRSNDFAVIDKADKNKIIKSIDNSLNIQSINNTISNYKSSAMSLDEINKISINDKLKKIANIYKQYEEYLLQNKLVDFDDLLLLPHKIMSEHIDIKEEISTKYQYIMVDEFQDTNKLQMNILKQLCYCHENIAVVGDDDQSIYSWRGADISNILTFKEKFKSTKIITLDTNYRSNPNILELSNNLITHNINRFKKTLKSTKKPGEEVHILSSKNEQEEAFSIAKKIKTLLQNGTNSSQIAILFRIHAISRALEEHLYKQNINYKIIGGIKFYERAEIKDIIAYFRTILLRDDFSLTRIINVPKRGIGKASIEKIKNGAQKSNLSIFEYLNTISLNDLGAMLGAKNSQKIKTFISDIEAMGNIAKNDIENFITLFEERFLLKEYYNSMPESLDKVANINEFYEYFKDSVDKNITMLEFMNDITLQSDQDKIQGECIYLMSIHASKGLEFENVFLVGLEDRVFPIISDDVDLEEERRLAYVAITRTKDRLFLCHSASRLYRGRFTNLPSSMFLLNMYKQDTKNTTRELSATADKRNKYKIGEIVKHKIFGLGKIEKSIDINNQQKLSINFGGAKRDILSSYVEKYNE